MADNDHYNKDEDGEEEEEEELHEGVRISPYHTLFRAHRSRATRQ
jgi:hypothetical protein